MDLKLGRVRESGMPDRRYWESFFDVTSLLEEIGFRKCQRALELGAGYGLFTMPLAGLCETLTTIEIDGNLCNELRTILHSKQCGNVIVVEGDFADPYLFAPNAFHSVVLFNILHMEDPPQLLNKLRLVMASDGKVFVLHWRTDIETPRGPSRAIRATPEQCRAWFAECGYTCIQELFPKSAPFHFAQVFSITSEVD